MKKGEFSSHEKTADQAENHPSLSETAVRNEKRGDDQTEEKENFKGPKTVLNLRSKIVRRFDVDHLNDGETKVGRSIVSRDRRADHQREEKEENRHAEG